MVRSVKDKYGIWLTGYYDDFTGARAIAEDTNSPNNETEYLMYKSHFGNPLNGEATLNPRYRWCILDRVRNNSTLPSGEFFASATNKLLHNKGLFEWISYDPTRNLNSTYQGRSQLEYPDGFTNVNKFRTTPNSTTGIYGSDAYQLFCNGHDTSTRYIVPTGTIDGSFARSDMVGYGDATTFANKTSGKNTISTHANITRTARAHLAGHWMGETINFGSSDTAAENVFATVESPSGQPFLCVQTWDKTGSNSTPSTPTLIYDGSLNSRDTGDWLHFRLAVRSFNGTTSSHGAVVPKVTIKAGFSGSVTATTLSQANLYGMKTYLEDGLTGTPAISFDLDLSGYDTHPMLYDGNKTAINNTTDSMWIDVDVHIDYTDGAQKFKVYQDGVLKSTNNFGATRTASAMYGWQIYTHSPLNTDKTVTTLMLDRAALYRPLTDDPSGKQLNPMTSLEINTTNNGISSASLQFLDEAQYHSDNQYGFQTTQYDQQIYNLFSGESLKEWYMLVFAGAGETGAKDIARIDRPIWKGIISNLAVKENLNDRQIDIEAQDALNILNRQLPLWEVGQGGLNTSETGSLYWHYEAEGMKEVMNMGANNLKTLAGTLGRTHMDSYENRTDQRMQLHSGHPIQIYNNEDSIGPNSLENDYEGMGVDYIFEESNGKITFVMTGNPGFGVGQTVTIKHTGISGYDDVSLVINAVNDVTTAGVTKEHVTFDAANTADIANNILDNDLVHNLVNCVVYAGKYIGASIEYTDPNYMTQADYLTSLSGTSSEEYGRLINYIHLVQSHPTAHYIEDINVLDGGENHYFSTGYYSVVNNNGTDTTIYEGPLNIPAPPSYTGYNAYDISETATAKWIADPTTGEITDAEVLTVGYGYTSVPTVGSLLGGVVTANNNGVKTFVESAWNTTLANGTYTDISTSVTGALTTLASNYTDGQTQLTLTDATGFNNSGTITVNGDAISYSGKSGNVLTVSDLDTNYSAGATVVRTNNVTGSGCKLDITVSGNEVTSITIAESISSHTPVLKSFGKNYLINSRITALIPLASGLGNGNVTSKITAITDDAQFEAILGGEGISDTFTLCLDVDPNLKAGGNFIFLGEKHEIKTIKKIYNYHGNASVTPYLWQIQTYTPYSGSVFGIEYGTWINNDGLLSSSNRKNLTTVTGGVITPAPTSEDVSNRVSHAVWMRDLPLSLWFQYHFGEIKYSALTSSIVPSATAANATQIEVTQACFNAAPNHGVIQIKRPVQSASHNTQKNINDFAIYRHKWHDTGNSKYYLAGVKYISLSHSATGLTWQTSIVHAESATQVYVLDLRNDYKHMWVLWADMRNDGSADADGGLRQKSFGLVSPKMDNYSLKLLFEDDLDEEGNPRVFTELKQNEDYDIWDIDSTIDDSTDGPFSRPLDYTNQQTCTLLNEGGGNTGNGTLKVRVTKASHGLSNGDYVGIWNASQSGHNGIFQITDASNSGYFIIDNIYLGNDTGGNGGIKYAITYGSSTDLSVYRDWHEKGGSMILIDTSKFFNLNTLANNGSVNQEVGGRTNLEDYYAISRGDVALIDNYYKYAPSTTLSTDVNYKKHDYTSQIVGDNTTLASNISKGHFWIEPSDVTLFLSNGIGRIKGFNDGSNSNYLFSWTNKLNTAESSAFTSISSADDINSNNYWTLTDSDATFITDGIKAGMYIKNNSKPLTRGTLTSYATHFIQDFYYRIKAVHSETVLHVEKVSYLPYNPFANVPSSRNALLAIAGESFTNTTVGLRIKNINDQDITDGWSATSSYNIPAQLAGVIIESATNITTDSTWSSSEIENAFRSHVSNSNLIDNVDMPYSKIQISNSDYIEVEVYNNVASQFAYRLMMKIDGAIESRNNGTFYHSDKLRTLWSAGMADTWWSNTKYPCIFDINNVPITNLMTTYDTTSQSDSYGGILNTQNKTVYSTIQNIQKLSGVGVTNGFETSFSYLIGRDNRLELRPKYNSGHSISRNGIKVSNMEIQSNINVENVRVYYNDNKNFADFPKPNLSDTTSWFIESNSSIRTQAEAEQLAKEIYRKKKKNNITLEVSPIRAIGDKDAMLDGGRYGYISDPQIAFQGNNDDSLGTGWCWTILGTGGLLFPGMVNALDGNLGSAPTTTLYNRVGTGSMPSYDATLDTSANYTWYGSRSVSKAVQIVHISKDTPKVSGTTGEKLRVIVSLKPDGTNTDVNKLNFFVWLADYSFDKSTSTTPSSAAARLDATLATNGSVSQEVKHSGFYELDVPTSYGTGKIVFSFNAEYCRDLVRSRCGASNTHKNAHDIAGIDLGSSFNTDSIFPLGARKYTELKGGIGAYRNEWYAPQLHIVDDLTYIPATYVSYTDASHSLDNEILVIQNIDWVVKAGDIEKLTLGLERDESRSTSGVVPYILDKLPINSHQESISVVDTPLPPAETIVQDITENDNQNINGMNPFIDFPPNSNLISPNSVSQGFYQNQVGSMNMGGSMFTPQTGHQILGQMRVPSTLSSMRGQQGGLTPHLYSGSAITDGDSFALPGSGKPQSVTDLAESGSEQKKYDTTHAVKFNVPTPSDAINDDINVTASLQLQEGTGVGKKAILDIDVRCKETNTRIQDSVVVSTGKQINVELISTQALAGVVTPGNNIEVIVSRRSGKTKDNAKYQSVQVSNLNVNFRRAAVVADSSSTEFVPYS